MNIELVTVVNNSDQYKSLITDNEYLLHYKKNSFNNVTENIPITKRYNSYISNSMPEDTWIVFCHQDFEFKQDLTQLLQDLDTSFIYGPIGAKAVERFAFYFHLFEPSKLKKTRMGKTKRMQTIGQIWENHNGVAKKAGVFLHEPELVDTVDCCCLIVHSSLINKHNLRFDEKLDWHSYSEDFSLNARINHHVQSKAVQIECIHYSKGSFNKGLEVSLNYLREKYNNLPFASTCYDGYYYNFFNRIKTSNNELT